MKPEPVTRIIEHTIDPRVKELYKDIKYFHDILELEVGEREDFEFEIRQRLGQLVNVRVRTVKRLEVRVFLVSD